MAVPGLLPLRPFVYSRELSGEQGRACQYTKPQRCYIFHLVVAVTALWMTPAVCIPLHDFIGSPFEDVATFPSVNDDFLTVNLAVPFRLGTMEYENVPVSS